MRKFPKSPPAPLFIDPDYHGSCDPEIVWNESDKQWDIYYTTRRPGLENTWLQTRIGVAASTDLIHWEFRGYCRFDGAGGIGTLQVAELKLENGKLVCDRDQRVKLD